MEPARKFKIIVNSKECGTCSGPTPSAVAKKVVKKLCGSSSKVVRFSLKECKRGCERVCGPYQGQMEKLDKPFKRSGKTITHRVVCDIVRKMRGGRDLMIQDFEIKEGDGEFRIDKSIGFEPYIFFGLVNNKYNYVIYCESWFGGKVVICDNKKNEVIMTNITDKNFIILLQNLDKYLKKTTKPSQFRRIKHYLNDNISNNNISKNNIGKLRKYYKHTHLNRIGLISDNLRNHLISEGVKLSNNKLTKLVKQEENFVRNQIEKSKKKHMKNNNITIRNVYDNIPDNEQNYYKRFFEEGKRKAREAREEEEEEEEEEEGEGEEEEEGEGEEEEEEEEGERRGQ